jgi:cation diffusion facilitator family transporter
VASLINFGVASVLKRAGRRYNSITLEADSAHLMTDVWTSVGVLVGVGLVALTRWERLDPIVALAIAANIIWSGVHLLRRSARGLMDTALPEDQRNAVLSIQKRYTAQGIQFHALRTREAGARVHLDACACAGRVDGAAGPCAACVSRLTCARHCRAQRSSRISSHSATRCPEMIRS